MFTDSKNSGRKTSPSKSPSVRGDERETERRSEELEKLRKQIDKYKDIVKQQEELIQVRSELQAVIHEKTYLRTCGTSKDSVQPVHSCSLIRIFTGHILDNQGCSVSSCGQTRLIRLHGCTG